MRIAGISVRDVAEAEKTNEINFDRMIQDALKLLKGEIEIAGADQDEIRDQLLGGYSHILVDEYQDIDQDQYDLVSAIAGRTLEEGEGRLSILAVGDDDQNIYAFRGANVQFIRKFIEDYPAQTIHLVENYRSSKHIINAANQLIRNNRDRMKGKYPIRVNRDRESSKAGGKWSLIDPVSMGRVQIITIQNHYHQAVSVLTELERIQRLSPDLLLEECAILSRTKNVLSQARSVLEQAGVPVKVALEKSFPLHRVREIVTFIDLLKQQGSDNRRTSEIIDMFSDSITNNGENIWQLMIKQFLESYRDETADVILPIGWVLDSFFEFIAEQQREKVLGNGIFHGTIHSAKGMEFPHVFILDGDWSIPQGASRWEEERRILYVAMTRAKETLTMMKAASKPNPFIKELKGESIISRKSQVKVENYKIKNFYNYEILGLNDIFMDYAGGFPSNHLIHKHISNLETSSEVFLINGMKGVEIHDHENYCVARLANNTSQKWSTQLNSIHKVRTLAMIRRNNKDPDESFKDRIKTETWDLPILEIVRKA